MTDIVERLRLRWEKREGAAARKISAILGEAKEAADEIERLRSGIKSLSDEEELCAETTGDDPFSMVYLAAKLAETNDTVSQQHQRILELQMLAWKWMEAHDCLKSGAAYEFPNPADLPNSLAEIERLRALTAPQLHQHGGGVDVDALAQEIRRVDGNHSLGAGALAEALLPFLTAALAQQPLSVPSPLPTPSVLHEWNLKTGRCTECNCHYVGFERKDPCPGPAPAHPTQSDVSCSRAREGGTE